MMDIFGNKIKLEKKSYAGVVDVEKLLKTLNKTKTRLALTLGVVMISFSSLKLNLAHDEIIKTHNKVIEEEENNFINQVKYFFLKYCSVYNLNYSKIYEKASELTNNFENMENEAYFNIPGTRVCGSEQVFDDLELAILCYIRHCKQIPGDFGFTKESILGYESEYSVYDSEELSCEEMVSSYCFLTKNVDRNLCMAIIYSENGVALNGFLYQNCNNPGNLCENGNFRTFDTLEEGIIEMVLSLEYNFLPDIIDLPFEEMIISLQKVYAPNDDIRNKDLRINENWVENVIDNYFELKEDYYSVYDKRINSTKKQM